jgi:bacillithiol biosynthesis cysteine-adding enzyme BshC
MKEGAGSLLCLPFSTGCSAQPSAAQAHGAVPHATPLFSAYLYNFSRVQSFYRRPPFPHNWLAEEARSIRYDPKRRTPVCSILERQNRAFGSGENTFTNLERLRNGACSVITGQQVSLFGGPLFSILKALAAVRLADEATAAGVNCVPVFWLATEDHDLEEVSHVMLPDRDGSLLRLESPTPAVPDTPVAQVRFGPEIEPAVARVAEIVGDPMAEILRAAYRPGASFGEAFARLFARLFRDWGVILLDAADPELHSLAAPLYEESIRRAGELHSRLVARGQELHEGGFHEQVKVTPSSTLLFAIQNGARTPIHRSDGRFVVGERKLAEAELIAEIRSAPEQFSANVLLRPVVQDYLLPTLAYVGGPAEVAYFAQAATVYEALLGRVTPVLPRLTVTLVEPSAKRLLDRYQLEVSDAFEPLERLRQTLAERTLPLDLQGNFDAAKAALDNSLGAIAASLQRLDPTLVEAADHAGAKMRYQLEHLRTRAANAELRRSEILARHAAQLHLALHPDHSLQERVIAGIYFLARYPGLLHSLYPSASLACPGHQVIFLQPPN